MLIALFTLFLLGGGLSDGSTAFLIYIAENRESIESVVTDDVRRGEALAILNTMDDRAGHYNEQLKKASEKLGVLVRDREDHSVEIAGILSRHREYTEAYGSEIVDLRFELKSTISRKEWAQIFSE